MSTLQVAKTIRDQIGAKTLFMLGAKNLAGGEDFFSFRIRGSKSVNYIKITLDPMDTYTMEFGRIRGLKYTVKAKHEGVYVDMLHEMIRNETGLETSFPRVRMD